MYIYILYIYIYIALVSQGWTPRTLNWCYDQDHAKPMRCLVEGLNLFMFVYLMVSAKGLMDIKH